MASLAAVPAAVPVWSLLSAALPGEMAGMGHRDAPCPPQHPPCCSSAPGSWMRGALPAGVGAPCLSFPPCMGCFGDAPAARPLPAVWVQSPQYCTFLGTPRDHKSLLSLAPPLRAGCCGKRDGDSGRHLCGIAVPAWWCLASPGQTSLVLRAPSATADPRDTCHSLPMPSQGLSP